MKDYVVLGDRVEFNNGIVVKIEDLQGVFLALKSLKDTPIAFSPCGEMLALNSSKTRPIALIKTEVFPLSGTRSTWWEPRIREAVHLLPQGWGIQYLGVGIRKNSEMIEVFTTEGWKTLE